MPSIHSVARQQHLKQERKEKMNNQITLKQLLLVATTEDISVYLTYFLMERVPFFSQNATQSRNLFSISHKTSKSENIMLS